MGSNLVTFLALLAVAVLAEEGHARLQPPQSSSPQEAYWKSELPNTPIPKAISHILPTGLSINDEKMLITNRDYKVYRAAGYKCSDDEDWSMYFMEADLNRPGKATMKLHFANSSNPSTFLQRKVVESMPFSSIMLPEILRRYSAKTGSEEAENIRSTVVSCVGPGTIAREDKACATSLESMVDFATLRLGNNLLAATSEVPGDQAGEQDYTVQPGSRKLPGDKLVVCHKLQYPYAVFKCHSFKSTEAYAIRVPLKGSDGTTAEPIGICHINLTAEWEKYFAHLKRLDVEFGRTTSLCHFLAKDTIVFAPKA